MLQEICTTRAAAAAALVHTLEILTCNDRFEREKKGESESTHGKKERQRQQQASTAMATATTTKNERIVPVYLCSVRIEGYY